ncbi:MotA/TolQ/ExbB proton channel family protein [Pseudoroseicyclus sp. H15]
MSVQSEGGAAGRLQTAMRGGAYDAVLRWVILVALICLGAAVLWDYGFLSYMFAVDQSRIAALIIIVFAGYSIYCLATIVRLGGEYRELLNVEERLAGPGAAGTARALAPRPGAPLVTSFLADVALKYGRDPDGDRGILATSFAASLRKPARAGLYASDLLYKLGMLGTVIGFVIMLGSMDDLTSFEVDNLRDALTQMTGGMAIALLTTIAGLVCGILLRVQFNIADSLASRIQARAVRASEVALVPALAEAEREALVAERAGRADV